MQTIEFLDPNEQEQLQLLRIFFQYDTHLSTDFIMTELNFGTRTRLYNIIQSLNSSDSLNVYHVHLDLFENSIQLSFDEHFSFSLAIRLFLNNSVKSTILQKFLHQEYVSTNQLVELLHVSRATLYRRLGELNYLLNEFQLQITNSQLVGTPTHKLNFYLLFYWATKRQFIFSNQEQLLNKYNVQIHHLCSSLGITESFDTRLRLATALQLAHWLSRSAVQAKDSIPDAINHPELVSYQNDIAKILNTTEISHCFSSAILMTCIAFINDQDSVCFRVWHSICIAGQLIPHRLTTLMNHRLNLTVYPSLIPNPVLAQDMLFLTNSFYYFYGCNIFNDAVETAFDQNDVILNTHLFSDLYASIQPILDPVIKKMGIVLNLRSLIMDYCLMFYTVWPINQFSMTIGIYSANGPRVLAYLKTWLMTFVPYNLTLKVVEPLTDNDTDIIITDLDGQSLNLNKLFHKPVIQLHFIGSVSDQNDIIHELGLRVMQKVFNVDKDPESK